MPTRNFVSDFGAVGDGQREAVNVTVTSGSPTLTVSSAIFDPLTIAGKSLTVWSASGSKTGVVQASPSPTSTEVTLNSNFSYSATSEAGDVLWGTDNASAFTGASGSWRAFAISETDPGDIPVLEVPDGRYCMNAAAMMDGVLNSARVTGVSGNAADCIFSQLNPNAEFRFGAQPAIRFNRGYNTTQTGGNSVRLQTAAAGAMSSTVVDFDTTAADGSTFGSRVVVGRACLLACFDMQGTNESFFGYPPNNYFFEWNVIAGYNAGTGVVTFETPLTQEYKSTYPRWGLENTQFGSDQGGPFTMWIAPDGYNNTVTLENLTIDNPYNQSAIHLRHWIGNNLVMSTGVLAGQSGLYPTQNDTVVLNNCVYPQELEIDKMTNLVTWNNCTIRKLRQQSASPNRMIINGGSIQSLETSKYTECNNATFTGTADITLGVTTHGRTNRVVLNGCTGIATIARTPATTDDLFGTTGTGSQGAASDRYDFSTGVLRFLKTDNVGNGGVPGNSGQQNLTRLLVPGTWIWFDFKYIDQVSDVYEDGTYCYIRFANTTSWPFTPVSKLYPHSCPDLTVTGCSGTASNLDDFQLAPSRSPAFSYSKRTIVAGASGTTVDGTKNPLLLGRFVSETLNVTTAYVGGVGNLIFNDSQFLNRNYSKRSDYTTSATFGSSVNMRIAGERVIRAATTPTGAQSNDSLEDMTTPGQVNFLGSGPAGTIFSANVTNGETPTVTVEYIMDHGIPPPLPTAVVPLRFRLRAS